MRFIDDNIRIGFKDLITNETKYFKAYLEKFDLDFKFVTSDFGFGTVLNPSKEVKQATLYTLNISLDVFSEDRDEVYDNYEKLLWMINLATPKYTSSGKPTVSTYLGESVVLFSGLPPNLQNRNYKILNFTYSINKDLGFIEVPKNKSDKNKLYVDKGMQLLPLGFKIGTSGHLVFNGVSTLGNIAGGGGAAQGEKQGGDAPPGGFAFPEGDNNRQTQEVVNAFLNNTYGNSPELCQDIRNKYIEIMGAGASIITTGTSSTIMATRIYNTESIITRQKLVAAETDPARRTNLEKELNKTTNKLKQTR